MLEVIVVAFQRPEGNAKLYRDIGLEDCTLGKHLKDCHILSIKILSLLGYPAQRQPTL